MILLLRPPRYLWPFNSETSAFWQPLGLLCLAAAARRAFPDERIEVWDAPGEQWGWRTFAERIAQTRIDVLGVGEETVSAHEALRAARLVKARDPDCLVVAGGTYFAHAIPEALDTGCVDAIVRGEGEITFTELLRHRHDRAAWRSIPGLAFRDDAGQLVLTPPRELIADLDTLPFPAYDLLDMTRYGRGARNHPDLVSIEHSRGCIDSCNFCILWKHMGRSVDGNGTFRPCYRTKSAERSFEEVERLHREFGRRTFGWVDPTFNADPRWSDGWAELMLRSPLAGARGSVGPRTLHTAWVRADCIVRDHKLGVLAKLVRAGLRQVMIGVERDDAAGLAQLGKHHHSAELCREAFAILRRHHPEVYTIGSVIFGLPGDTPADLRRLARCDHDFQMDYCFWIPLTPNPGTPLTAAARAAGQVASADLTRYDFHTPVCDTGTLGVRQVEQLYWQFLLRPDFRRFAWRVRQALWGRDRRKRHVHRALLRHGAALVARRLWRRVCRPWDSQPPQSSRRPSWYDN